MKIMRRRRPSMKTALGITKAKRSFARATGIPTTKQGRKRKAMNALTGGAYGKVTHSDGSANDGIVGTGDVLTIYDKNGGEMARYTFVIYGDVNGDGAVTSMDLLYVKRHILGTKLLEEPYLTAADANRGNDGITSIDLLYIKRHILDIRYIEQ